MYDVRCIMYDVRKITDLRFSMSVGVLTSYIVHLTSYIVHLTSYIVHLTSYILHRTSYIRYPLSMLMVLMLWTACQTESSKAEAAKAKAEAAERTIRTMSYIDNGAVVPFPNKRQVTFMVDDTNKISLNYLLISGQKDSTKEKMAVLDAERREELYDNISELADYPDDVDIKPGKLPCVGSNSIDISLAFANGDTSRFSIMGGARCDPSLCPPFWAIDSLVNLLIAKK
jgi:hypothetical protein